MLGVLGSLRYSAAPRWPRFAIDTLHRDISLLVIAVLVVHIITSVLDSFAPIRLIDAVIPFVSTYRPLWLGLGALAFDLMIALVITSLLRRRLGYGAWRLVHWLAYASWPVALLHGLGTGSDTKRVVDARAHRRLRRRGARGGAGADHPRFHVVAGVAGCRRSRCRWWRWSPCAAFTLLGPLRPHWARRAGTPRTLLGLGSR